MFRKCGTAVAVALSVAAPCVWSIGGLLGMPAAAFAENVLEFPFPEVVTPARQASAELLDAASKALAAMRQAELGETDAANQQLLEALSELEQSREGFTAVGRQIQDRPISLDKAPKEINGVAIDRILATYKIEMPRTTRQLANIAVGEAVALREAIGALRFEPKGASRTAVFRVSQALHRALDVGVVVSMLADAAQS